MRASEERVSLRGGGHTKKEESYRFTLVLTSFGGLFEERRNKETCSSTSERDLDYASVYPTECCVAAGDSLLAF